MDTQQTSQSWQGAGGGGPGASGWGFLWEGVSPRPGHGSSQAAAPPDGNDDDSGGPSKCRCRGLWQQLRETEAEPGPLGLEGE